MLLCLDVLCSLLTSSPTTTCISFRQGTGSRTASQPGLVVRSCGPRSVSLRPARLHLWSRQRSVTVSTFLKVTVNGGRCGLERRNTQKQTKSKLRRTTGWWLLLPLTSVCHQIPPTLSFFILEPLSYSYGFPPSFLAWWVSRLHSLFNGESAGMHINRHFQ